MRTNHHWGPPTYTYTYTHKHTLFVPFVPEHLSLRSASVDSRMLPFVVACVPGNSTSHHLHFLTTQCDNLLNLILNLMNK